jgi:succinylglutamate desuccinylase
VHSFRVQNATTIDEQSLEKFEVYPTQTNGLVHIKSTASNEEKNLQLFGVKGQLLLQKQWFEAETDIDLSNFSEGIYFIKFKTDNFLQTEKIIFNNY